MDYLDNMEEEYHKSYPDDPCPMDGGYKASFERFVIDSLRAEWGILNFPARISLISRIFRNLRFFRSQATYSCNSCNSCSVTPISNLRAGWFLNTNLSNLTNLRLLRSFSIETKWESPLLATTKSVQICEIRVSPSKKYSRNRLAFSKESRIFAGVKI